MNSKRINQLLLFLKEIEKLKLVERKVLRSDRKNYENDAEHSWHVAMFVMIFEKEFPNLDTSKMLKMVLIHDLVEIYAGDTFAFDNELKKTQKEREQKAAKKLFSILPNDLEKEFHQLFREYENGTSKEGLVARSFDKLQPIMQNILSRGDAWKKNKVTYRDIDNYKRSFMTHDKKILKIYDIFLNEIKRKKLA